MSAEKITQEELFAEWQRLMDKEPPVDDGFRTTEEHAAIMKCGDHKMRRLIREAIRQKRCEVGRRREATISGSTIQKPTYKLLRRAKS